jgi:hypothetical protein
MIKLSYAVSLSTSKDSYRFSTAVLGTSSLTTNYDLNSMGLFSIGKSYLYNMPECSSLCLNMESGFLVTIIDDSSF